MSNAETYLKPEVIRQVARLDLKAKFIVEGFLAGLHASPFHGFSVEFSEHRKYSPGDDIRDIDWNVYAKTDRFYIKKFQAETNLDGFLAIDVSNSMGMTPHGEMTKLDYAICLAASLGYLMIRQQDPVGLFAFSDRIRLSLPPKSRRSQLANILTALESLKPEKVASNIAACLHRIAEMVKHRGLIMIFSDLMYPDALAGADPVIEALRRFRYRGHDVIVFHILDQAEALFPFDGLLELEDNETDAKLVVDAAGIRADYLEAVATLRNHYAVECGQSRIDYVPLHTGMPFDKALLSYLISRRGR
ncbi:protein of unknown function DUF58 [Isosphaera pallida ATCC 43644]|jgi:uncharacterized protein (DUF58 family)|uniref:DUF58 domain-containing protein n=1 Tax=Isosphaera pallida (strain ATCC 43644 / DSM 9630 / IS1B) TaxID=575540 RepID=E8QYN2_ISOPI|nr:DUF58 domain-containing protein [Isosphaera pallida]ADV61008.1 protein of unknown function DUF58 [Isosphaera pallida ATCC 43644]